MLTDRDTSQTTTVRGSGRGWWTRGASDPDVGNTSLSPALQRVGRPVYVVDDARGSGVATDGMVTLGTDQPPADGLPLCGLAPALQPEQLGDPRFRAAHGVRFAYVCGAMANGIASVEMVEATGQAGMLGFFGSAGLELDEVEQAIERVQNTLGESPYGFNLINSPHDPEQEKGLVDLYLRRGVRLISAAAYLQLTPPLVRYRVSGIHRDETGKTVTPHKVVAKVSRVEVARRFFSPPPEEMLRALVAERSITAEQAELARTIPLAEDLTAEADSGGHTDNRPALALLPTMLALRDEMQRTYGYHDGLRVGAAGGLATPAAVAAAFAMGAAYVLTGSVNQSCVESGTSETVREMLSQAKQADVMMAPAADMFEMGVRVQVLKRGTMFPMRARKLYELYRTYGSIEDLPADQRKILERDYFRTSLHEVWTQTRDFFARRDPRQIDRAEREPKHKMALVFRSYLGQSSNWANSGDPSRRTDYQVWCGPAMGAFNGWVRGSFLEDPQHRHVVTVAMNLLVGAAALTRAAWLRAQGVVLGPEAERFDPRSMEELSALTAADA